MASHSRSGGRDALSDVLQQMIEDAARLQVQEALRLQEQSAATVIEQFGQQLQERDEVIRALRQSLDEGMQRMEARMTAMEERVGSCAASGGSDGAAGHGPSAQLETRMGKLEEAVQRAVTTVFPRVEALVAQLEEPSRPAAPHDAPSTSSAPVAPQPPAASARGETATPGPAFDEESERRRIKQLVRQVRGKRNRARASPCPLGEDLCQAAWEGRLEDVRMFLDLGADVNYTSSDGYSPLISTYYLCNWGNGDPDVLSLLLQRGANVNTIDTEGMTVLHCAAFHDPTQRGAALLIAAGADIHARDKLGVTPLHRAAFGDNLVAALALLAAGANKSSRCWAGPWKNKTPIEIANCPVVRDVLR